MTSIRIMKWVTSTVAGACALAFAIPASAELIVETIETRHPASEAAGESFEYEFPVVAGESTAAENINTYLHAIELKQLPGRSEQPFEAVWPGMEPPFHGLVGISFHVLSNQPGFVSIAVYYSYMAAYPSEGVRNYNFDARSGEPLFLQRIFDADGLTQLNQQVIAARLQRIDDFLAGKSVDAYGTTLSDDPDIAEEQTDLYTRCREYIADGNIRGGEVKFAEDSLELSGESCAPHSQMAIDDLGNFNTSLPYVELATSFNAYGRCLLVEQRADCPSDRMSIGAGVYRGQVGGRYPITLVLAPDADSVYFYDKYATAIPISVSWQEDGTVQLDENGEPPARFDLRWSDDAVTGTWTQEGKSPLAVELR